VKNLEKVNDVKGLFAVELPKTWKINLFYDEIQSSIYTADTTKQFTETILLDITYIEKPILFNEAFLLNLEREKLGDKLIRIHSQKRKFKGKEAYFTTFIGKKKNYKYKVLEMYVKINKKSFLHTKTEIYGDSLIDQRLCKAIHLIDKINF
jgi:hypothetical protein